MATKKRAKKEPTRVCLTLEEQITAEALGQRLVENLGDLTYDIGDDEPVIEFTADLVEQLLEVFGWDNAELVLPRIADLAQKLAILADGKFVPNKRGS